MKELIIWSEGYSVGIQEIDDQHKKLIGLINQLYNLYLDKRSSEIASIIKEIKAYTLYHFSTEEKLFRECKYKDMLSHIQMHEGFINDLNDITKNSSASNDILTMKTMTFLQRWLTNHIMKEDKKYVGHLK